MLARAGLHLGATTVGRMLKGGEDAAEPTPAPTADLEPDAGTTPVGPYCREGLSGKEAAADAESSVTKHRVVTALVGLGLGGREIGLGLRIPHPLPLSRRERGVDGNLVILLGLRHVDGMLLIGLGVGHAAVHVGLHLGVAAAVLEAHVGLVVGLLIGRGTGGKLHVRRTAGGRVGHDGRGLIVGQSRRGLRRRGAHGDQTVSELIRHSQSPGRAFYPQGSYKRSQLTSCGLSSSSKLLGTITVICLFTQSPSPHPIRVPAAPASNRKAAPDQNRLRGPNPLAASEPRPSADCHESVAPPDPSRK